MPVVRPKAKTVKSGVKSIKASKQARGADKSVKNRENPAKVTKKVTAKNPVRRSPVIRNTFGSELKQKLADAIIKFKEANKQIINLKQRNEEQNSEIAKMGDSDFELLEYCREKYRVAEEARIRLSSEVTSLKEILQTTSNFKANEREELLSMAKDVAIKYRAMCVEKDKEIQSLKSSINEMQRT